MASPCGPSQNPTTSGRHSIISPGLIPRPPPHPPGAHLDEGMEPVVRTRAPEVGQPLHSLAGDGDIALDQRNAELPPADLLQQRSLGFASLRGCRPRGLRCQHCCPCRAGLLAESGETRPGRRFPHSGVSAWLPVTARLPSPVRATDKTGSVWPLRVWGRRMPGGREEGAGLRLGMGGHLGGRLGGEGGRTFRGKATKAGRMEDLKDGEERRRRGMGARPVGTSPAAASPSDGFLRSACFRRCAGRSGSA